MPANPRSIEDKLTDALARALAHAEYLEAFWRLVAPARLHRAIPDRFESFSRLGTSKPDLLFFSAATPVLYLEAKLGAQIEPLQLIRARSWMRRNGALDDQTVLVCNYTDVLPEEIGWPANALPVRAISWTQIRAALFEATPRSLPASSSFQVFAQMLAAYSSATAAQKLKSGLRSSFGHEFGAVLHEFLRNRKGAQGDFVYGGRIAPRLAYGFPCWRDCLGSTECERILLFYGPDGRMPENYRAQLILWHTSDIAESESAIRLNWPHWRKAILAEPLAEFEWGGRQHTDRHRGALPFKFPNSMVGIVNLPTSLIQETAVRRLSQSQLLDQLGKMVAPLERIIGSVAIKS